MLSDATIAVIKSTAPILKEHGETLTRHFYERMFQNNPEVIPFFNPSHQHFGNQQRALANAIAAYAENIDNLGVLGGAVEMIAQKHASLLVKKEHYPIVGDNLLASISEVLGKGATPEILDAWANAYAFLTDILVSREQQIYMENAQKVGGWEGFKPFKILRKEQESKTITSLYLVPEDGGPLPHFEPGQYVTVRVPTHDGSTTMRNYSLSDKPHQEWLRISVKREEPSNAPLGYVSTMVHDHVCVGDSLEVAPPCGTFFLDQSDATRPLVFLGAGVGITPLHSMLLHALDVFPTRPIFLIHAVVNEDVQAFQKVYDTLIAHYPHLKVFYRYSEEPEVKGPNKSYGYVTQDYLKTILPHTHGEYYVCGPKPFMTSVYNDLIKVGVEASKIHVEFFGPHHSVD